MTKLLPILLLAACLDEPTTLDQLESAATVGPGVQVTSLNGGGCWDMPLPQPVNAPIWLQQFPCHGDWNQVWRFDPVPGSPNVYVIRLTADISLCLDLPWANTASGQDVQLHTCNGGKNQKWLVDEYRGVIKPILDISKCLDVENGIATNQARIQIFSCHGGANQAWRFRTWLAEVSGFDILDCDGQVRFANTRTSSTTVAPYTAGSFAVDNGGIRVYCDDGRSDAMQCPNYGTTWMVADRRNGPGDFTVTCFRD